MEYHLQSGSHTVYALQYHFVTVTKNRTDNLTDERLERVPEVTHEIADDFEADIKNVDGGTDHVHILFTTNPTTDLTKFINSLKGHFAPDTTGVSRGERTPRRCLLATGVFPRHYRPSEHRRVDGLRGKPVA